MITQPHIRKRLNIKNKRYALTLDDIVNDPLCHFHYQGFKYIALDILQNMKMLRDESKDTIDLKLIRQVQ